MAASAAMSKQDQNVVTKLPSNNGYRDMLNVYYSGVVLIELVTGWKAMNLKQLKDHIWTQITSVTKPEYDAGNQWPDMKIKKRYMVES
ncbi:hypothetical protein Godav_004942 [Gossypium davidsonii]|uniref:Uncharacterized protein n=1 Tax=Gossypium davidsonii TaxID=34287 RepID=A0A7J8SMU9_GOSDV|nr:hypothetical protein [Gossypium davidsonii]